eukprot:1160252-Pelagomonas_calceolata.AAC.12
MARHSKCTQRASTYVTWPVGAVLPVSIHLPRAAGTAHAAHAVADQAVAAVDAWSAHKAGVAAPIGSATGACDVAAPLARAACPSSSPHRQLQLLLVLLDPSSATTVEALLQVLQPFTPPPSTTISLLTPPPPPSAKPSAAVVELLLACERNVQGPDRGPLAAHCPRRKELWLLGGEVPQTPPPIPSPDNPLLSAAARQLGWWW